MIRSSEDPNSRTVDDSWNLFKTSQKTGHIQTSNVSATGRSELGMLANTTTMFSYAYKRYLKLNHQVKVALQRFYRGYIDNILNINITETPKNVYSYIKQKKAGESVQHAFS